MLWPLVYKQRVIEAGYRCGLDMTEDVWRAAVPPRHRGLNVSALRAWVEAGDSGT